MDAQLGPFAAEHGQVRRSHLFEGVRRGVGIRILGFHRHDEAVGLGHVVLFDLH